MRAIYLLALAIFMCSCNNEPAATEETNETETTSTAVTIDVPGVVKEAFAAAYPQATDIEWEIEGDKYEVEYEIDGKEAVMIYNADGTLYANEVDIAITALPEAVAKAAAANGEANEASKITLADGTVQYEVGIAKKDYTYAADGTLLGEEVDEGDDDDDKDEE